MGVDPVLFVGAFTQDTLYSVESFAAGASKYFAKERVCQAAGMATTAATAAARLGGKAALWASLGDDPLGDSMLAEIEAEGVDCRHVRRVAGGRSASATIIVDSVGERWVIVDYDPVTQEDPVAETSPSFEQFSAVLADTRWPGAARLALLAARDAGRPAILDADVAAPEVLLDLASCATHIVASLAGAAILSETSEIETAATTIRDRFGCFTCITNGAAGTVWTAPGCDLHSISPPKIKAVDTNAAGDVFHGAFTLALAEGQCETQAIRFASAAAALKCTVAGGRFGAPNREETLALMNDTYTSQIPR